MTETYTRIEVRPMAGALGADVHGVDLAKPLDDATFAEIERAFHDRLVLFFHDQRLTPEQHLAFSRRLGRSAARPTSSTWTPIPTSSRC
jgi:taurine dioxygenase